MIGEFLPKVESSGSTAVKTKEKLNVTHYYTQSNKRDNQWMTQGGQGQKFMPFSSNASSVEAIANRLI